MTQVILRPYQDRAVEMLREGIRAGYRKQILMSPTGSGKTEIGCFMLQEAQRKGARALFIVDRVVLVDQTSDRLDQYGISHGVIQSGHWRFRTYENIQVCSAQTIERRGIPDDVSVIFVDEAHCLRKKIVEHLQQTDAIVIGLSATPFTKGLASVYSNLVNVITMNELIEQKYLVPLKMYAAKSINVEGMKIVAGEWSEKDIQTRGLEIVGDIIAEWKSKTELHFGGPVKTIVFSATVDHGAELCRQFQAAGFNFHQISYKDGGDEHRRALIAEFRRPDSEIHGLISCEVFTKGFDVPDVLCGVSARPYRKSLSSHIQQMGRVMRSAPGKDFGLWLDHSGNCLRFMEDTSDIFQSGCSTLDDGIREEKARKEPTEKERAEIRCSCGYILMAYEKVCPSCGKERRKTTTVEAVPGQLFELEMGKRANKVTGWPEKAAFYAGLKSYASERGYKPGYAANQYRMKFGVWPNDPRVHHVEPGPVTPEIVSWIKSRQIAYAKARRVA